MEHLENIKTIVVTAGFLCGTHCLKKVMKTLEEPGNIQTSTGYSKIPVRYNLFHIRVNIKRIFSKTLWVIEGSQEFEII